MLVLVLLVLVLVLVDDDGGDGKASLWWKWPVKRSPNMHTVRASEASVELG